MVCSSAVSGFNEQRDTFFLLGSVSFTRNTYFWALTNICHVFCTLLRLLGVLTIAIVLLLPSSGGRADVITVVGTKNSGNKACLQIQLSCYKTLCLWDFSVLFSESTTSFINEYKDISKNVCIICFSQHSTGQYSSVKCWMEGRGWSFNITKTTK